MLVGSLERVKSDENFVLEIYRGSTLLSIKVYDGTCTDTQIYMYTHKFEVSFVRFMIGALKKERQTNIQSSFRQCALQIILYYGVPRQ
jgi:hypothetical protein